MTRLKWPGLLVAVAVVVVGLVFLIVGSTAPSDSQPSERHSSSANDVLDCSGQIENAQQPEPGITVELNGTPLPVRTPRTESFEVEVSYDTNKVCVALLPGEYADENMNCVVQDDYTVGNRGTKKIQCDLETEN